MEQDDNFLFAEAVLGRQIQEDFFNSDIGRYISGRAEIEVKKAQEKLEEVSPRDTNAIESLQFEIRVAKGAIRWLNEAIINGKNAEHILEERDHE